MTTPALGVFARVFPAGTASEVAAAVRAADYAIAQLNLSALGLPTIPGDWSIVDTDGIKAAFTQAGVELWGLSCTYNMAHPDDGLRSAGTRGAVELIRRAPSLGIAVVTLCTGSRDVDWMWAAHPDNSTPLAWTDFRRELDVLLEAASAAGVVLGIEPEPGNVVCDADAAARLLDELGAERSLIGIIVDSANLLATVPRKHHRSVLDRAFDVLGQATVCLHAKDLVPWEQTLGAAGVVPYEYVAQLYSRLPEGPPIIVQDVPAAHARRARDFVADIFM